MIYLHESVGIDMKCPNCGRDMDSGYLTIPLHFGIHSMKWSDKPRHSVLSDDVIYDPKSHDTLRTGWSAIPAERCTACRTVVFSYLPSDDSESSPSTPGMMVRRA